MYTEIPYKRIQEFIFWRRPLTTGFFYIIFQVIFIVGYFLHFNFLCSFFFALLLCNLWSFSTNETKEFFFQPEIDDSKNTNRDRIRSDEEVEEIVCKWKDIYRGFRLKLRKFRKKPTLGMLLMFFLFSVSSYEITHILGSWLISYLIMNAFFLAPLFFINFNTLSNIKCVLITKKADNNKKEVDVIEYKQTPN